MCIARQTKGHLKKIVLLPNRPSPDWIDNACDGLISSSARTLSLKYVYISRERWSSLLVFKQLSYILQWSSGLRLFLDPDGSALVVWCSNEDLSKVFKGSQKHAQYNGSII